MDNVQSMMYNTVVPWHKKGVKLNGLATSAEAIKAASLDWEVEKREIFYPSYAKAEQGSKYAKLADKFAIVRKDNDVALGIVGDVYTPLQNKHAFRFFDDVIGEAKAHYETAGALGVGERIWLLAKLPDVIKIKNHDITEKYLLLTNSHNGSSTIQILFTPIRVVCQNTLNIALKGDSEIARIRHCQSSTDKIEYVRKTLGIINERFSEFSVIANQLANKMMTTEMLDSYLKKSLFDKKEGEQKIKTRAANIMEEVTKLFEYGKGNDSKEIRHTAWVGFNAVAEYIDYQRSTKKDRRDESILFGKGQAIKQIAWDNAVALLK